VTVRAGYDPEARIESGCAAPLGVSAVRRHRLAAGVGPATGLGVPGRRYLPSHWPDDNMLPKCGSTG
jgi:hypothetical protein